MNYSSNRQASSKDLEEQFTEIKKLRLEVQKLERAKQGAREPPSAQTAARLSKHKKEVEAVLIAARQGCQTTREVSEMTGMPVATCSRYVTELLDAGLLRHTGTRVSSPNGSSFKVFEVVSIDVKA